jgi:hypothetical protein
MNKEDLAVLPIAALGLAKGIGEVIIKPALSDGFNLVKNAARVAIYHAFSHDNYEYPISASLTYHGSPVNLEDDRTNLYGPATSALNQATSKEHASTIATALSSGVYLAQ